MSGNTLRPRCFSLMGRITGICTTIVCLVASAQTFAERTPEEWLGDLTPIAAEDWNYARARHLLERAGFGGTPEDIRALTTLTPEEAVKSLVYHEHVANNDVAAFDHSGVHDPGLDPFPPSRPATTKLAKETGEALGVKVKASGNRRLQPVVNRFFYWLRASMLEANRVAYWWANRMLISERPLQEKMALFWHDHFASNEAKVRDYRKMLKQIELFQNSGTGNFRDLVIGVAQDPAMLAFLDAGVNTKGSPNENFAREIMELFTLGVGQYTEQDIREAARAFTGWNFVGLEFHVNEAEHDAEEKTFLGHSGNFDGVDIIDIILQQPATAEFVSAKLYRAFVREDLQPQLAKRIAQRFRNDYAIAPLLETLFLSKDFYSDASIGNHIKGPVELVISTYRKLGLTAIPGVPDFNDVTSSLGQHLLQPPTVAGWAEGRSWVTPGLLIARGNFAYQVLFPNINFIAHDRYPRDGLIRAVHEKISRGMDISSATMPDAGGGNMAMANAMADRDEDFNTRYGSYKGWQMAIQRVKPTPRDTADIDLSLMVRHAGLETTTDAVDYLLGRFLNVSVDQHYRAKLIAFLDDELGTSALEEASTYMEEPLRQLVHLILSTPEYHLG